MDEGMSDSIRVLHVDDEPGLADMVGIYLERSDDRISVRTGTNAEDGLQALAEDDIHCIVSDYDMPGPDGIEFLENVREMYPDLPFILYTGKGSEEVAADAISAGVTDYLQKEDGTDQYTILANRVVNAVSGYRAEREAAQTQAQLQAISEYSTDAIVIVDADSRIRFANPAIESHFGYTPAELEGERLTTIMPRRYRERHLSAVEQYLETGERSVDWTNVEFPGLHEDGSEIPLSVSFGAFQQDGEQRFLGIIRDISKRTQMEAELREREERFRQLAENIEEVVWMSDLSKDELLYVNQAYEDIWGQSTDNLYEDPMSFLEAIHPDDRERVEAILDTQPDGTYDTEYRVVRPDGELRWVRDRAVPVENDAGEVYRIVGITSDITERKEQTRRLETLISNLPGMVYRCQNEPGWPMTLVRGECEELTGYTAAAVERGDVNWGEELIHPDDRDHAWTVVQEAVDENRPFELTYRIRTKDGATRWMWERGRVVNAGQTAERFLEGFITDVTERMEREQQFEALNRIIQELMVADSQEEIVEIGVETTRDLLGMEINAIHLYDDEADALIPVAITDAAAALIGEAPTFSDDDSIAWRVFHEGEPRTIDDVHEDPDRYNPDTQIRSELILPLGTYGILLAGSPTPETFDEQDVLLGEILAGGLTTALEQVERAAQVRARERDLTAQNTRLEEFASIVSHDLRNPLNVAEGHLELAAAECESDHMEPVARAHDRMRTLIEDLLALAREGTAETDIEPVTLSPLIEGCWANVETETATLVTETERRVRADRSRLKQLFENLMRNAVEHGGSDVTVTVGELDSGFYVEDDGVGITADDRDVIFDTGYSTRPDGTGFGLSIVEQIVDAHGWEIDVTDSAEGGARFEITGVEFAGD